MSNCVQMHKRTRGAHVMNDHVESHFGSYDFLARIFRHSTVENVSGMTQSKCTTRTLSGLLMWHMTGSYVYAHTGAQTVYSSKQL